MTRDYFEYIGFMVQSDPKTTGGRNYSLNFVVGEYVFLIVQFSECVMINGSDFIPEKGSPIRINAFFNGREFVVESSEPVTLRNVPMPNSFKLIRQMAGNPIMDVIKPVLWTYYKSEAI